ncbi:MAG: BatA domain-containing protein [Isosphaeraceae bacterium]
MQPPVLFAFGFANLAMLSALGAASIPIIIHLLNRRKFREERWAAMRFLLAAIRKNQRRIRIEQWLLLAVRTLLIVCVVLAMARPFLESIVPVFAGQRTHRVLALDGSLSMGTKAGETTRFDQAKQLAARLVKDARQGDALSVVVLGEPPRVVIGAPSANHAEVLKELTEVTMPHGGTDLTASIQAINRVLEASTIAQKEVVVLTDLQAASWRRGGAGPDQALKRALTTLEARRARSVVIDLGAPGGANLAITDLKLNTPLIAAGMTPPPLVVATIHNFGTNPVESVQVRLVVRGVVGPAADPLTIPAGEERAVIFTDVDFGGPGECLIQARIDDDPLPLDNMRWLSVPVREALQVLLVDGDRKSEPFRSETDYLAVALAPEPESPGTPSPIKVEVAPESQLSTRDLARYDAVVLCNLARFTSAEVSALDAYLKQGGGVVVFGGDQVRADNYNEALFAIGQGILPAEVGPTVGDTEGSSGRFVFNPLGFKHPIIAEFTGQSPGVTASLTRVKTARFHKLILPKNTSARVALAFDNGDPAVIEAPRHRGRVIQVATTADVGWTTWPLHPSYPAVMQQIVLEAASGRTAERNVRVGQPIDQALPPTGADAPVTITRPDGKGAKSKLLADGDVSRLFYEETDLEGPYAVRVAAPVSLEAVFAANPDPAESDPKKLDRRSLSDALPGWNFDYRNDVSSLFDDATSVRQRGELHRPLLWAVLALLIVESVLAWRFGHHV